jgi:hypothetical protein
MRGSSILGVVIILLNITLLKSQNNALNIYTSYSIGKVDNRIDFLFGKYPLSNDPQLVNKILTENTPDDTYSIGFGYQYSINSKLALNIDIGYALLMQDFLLPVNSQTFFNVADEKFYWRLKSYYQMIQIGPSVQYVVIDKCARLGFNLQSIGNISFRKVVQDGNLSRNKTEYFSNELYPGIFAEYKRFKATLGVRALHWKYRDDAIANNGLNPDKYNPFKMKFTLSYDIYRW